MLVHLPAAADRLSNVPKEPKRMNFHRVLIVAGMAGAMMLPLTATHAQESLSETSVSGVCMLSRGAVLANSKVGQAADARLQQLAQQAGSELESTGKALDQSIKQFRAKAESLSESERTSQQQELQRRLQAFQQKERKLSARVRLTRAKAMEQIGTAIDPLISDIYLQRDCGILLDRDNVLGGNVSNDLTPAVTQALDNKMTTISFDLAPLPQQQSSQ